MQNWLNYILE